MAAFISLAEGVSIPALADRLRGVIRYGIVNILKLTNDKRRDKKGAKKFFSKLSEGLRYIPRMIITDKLRNSSAAKAEVLPSLAQCRAWGIRSRGSTYTTSVNKSTG
jgi:transposase-like protein